MYKITWGRKSDRFHRTFVIVSDVQALFEAYYIILGYGRQDGSTPIDVRVTNLDGHDIDMSKGLADAAMYGTRSSE